MLHGMDIVFSYVAVGASSVLAVYSTFVHGARKHAFAALRAWTRAADARVLDEVHGPRPSQSVPGMAHSLGEWVHEFLPALQAWGSVLFCKGPW